MTAGFEGRKVLVTGGARGIGEACVLAFRAGGAQVAVGARGEASYAAFVERNGGEGFVPAIGDLHGQAACAAVVEGAVSALGGLDVLVASAGIFQERPPAQITEQAWEETLAVNTSAVFYCIQAALPSLEAAGGNVVAVVSDAGLIGYPGAADYCAAKGAVANLTRALALDLAPRVRVNGVCPGNVETDMIQRSAQESSDPQAYLERAKARSPMGRMARPEEVAAAVLFLASGAASFVNGALLPVDGGGTAGF